MPSLGISVLLPMQDSSIYLLPSLGVFDTRCPPRTSIYSASHLPPSYTFWCLWYWLPSWDIFVLLHAQTNFSHPESSFLDVFCPPGASPSLTCKSPSSLLEHHFLMSSVPGVLLGHLHLPPHSSRLHLPCIISWCPWHWVPSWGSFHTSYPTVDAATCLHPPVTSAHAAGCNAALLPTGTSCHWAPAPKSSTHGTFLVPP